MAAIYATNVQMYKAFKIDKNQDLIILAVVILNLVYFAYLSFLNLCYGASIH